MPRLMSRVVAGLIVLVTVSAHAISPEAAQKLYDQAAPSLVAVRYTWENELGRRELTGAGVVVSDDGLVMRRLSDFDQRAEAGHMKDLISSVAPPDRGAEESTDEFGGRHETSTAA